MDRDLLFVYGTLRRGSGHRMHAALAEAARFVDSAVFRGRLYRVARYPGVVESADPRDRVLGDVYRLAEPQAILRRLDRYEGCDPADPESAYLREWREIVLGDGKPTRAWVYLYNRSIADLPRIPSGDFLADRTGRQPASSFRP